MFSPVDSQWCKKQCLQIIKRVNNYWRPQTFSTNKEELKEQAEAKKRYDSIKIKVNYCKNQWSGQRCNPGATSSVAKFWVQLAAAYIPNELKQDITEKKLLAKRRRYQSEERHGVFNIRRSLLKQINH